MESRHLRPSWRIVTAFVFGLACLVPVLAQGDPDPNSPTPVLLTEVETTRALARTPKGGTKADLSRLAPQAFKPGSKVVLYVANLDLMKGEGANALRIYASDSLGRSYRFPVLELEPHAFLKNLHVATVHLRDEIGYWPEPVVGDLYLYLTWRGLASNTVKIGYGSMGGLKDRAGLKPAPLSVKGTRVVTASPASSGEAPEYVGYRWSGDRHRFLQQAAFGPTPALDQRLRRIGIRTWLAEQFEAPYPSVTNPYPNQPLKPVNAPPDCDGDQTVTPDVPATCFRDTYTMYPIQAWNTKEMFYGEAQLRHRVAWALSQIWVTSGNDIQQSRHMVEYHKVLSQNAFGNFRNLMEQMTLNPTMGTYLDMAVSTRTNPNENYAREIMQLFTIGLFMMNPNGTLQCYENNPCQPGNTPIPTYDQNVVNDLTKVLTGWRLCSVAASCPNLVSGTLNYIDPMLLNAGVNQGNINNNLHDLTAKTLLSYPGSTTTNIAACSNCTTFANITTYANNSMDQALDNIFYHPNVGPFISKLLIQHMVTSDPTPAYVGRVAAVFNDNGLGVRGDLKAVVRAILLDPEARGEVKTDPNYGKLREPMQYATNFLRAFGVRNAAGTGESDGVIFQRGEFTGMAQIPFRSPTVFNYYPPDFVVPGTALLGPEFALMTTGTSISRANFINRFVFTSIPVAVSTDAPQGTSLDFSDLQAISAADSTGNLLVDELNRRLLYGTMTAAMRTQVLNAVTAVSSTDTLGRVRQAVYLIGTSSQYQVQR